MQEKMTLTPSRVKAATWEQTISVTDQVRINSTVLHCGEKLTERP